MKYTSHSYHKPEQIEDLGTGFFFYNFNIREEEKEGFYYNQIRFEYPVNEDFIKAKTESLGFKFEEILNY